MSLEVDGVWKTGVWATTVWASGVWREGAPVAPTSPNNINPDGVSFKPDTITSIFKPDEITVKFN